MTDVEFDTETDTDTDYEFDTDEFDAEVDADEVEATTEHSDEDAPKRARIAPKYGINPVGDLPEDEKTRRKPGKRAAGGGRDKNMFVNLLTPIVEDPELHGIWIEVVQYSTGVGAKTAKKAIEAGERLLPDGQWEFETRRFNMDDVDKDGDVIYLVGEDGNIVTDSEGNAVPQNRRISKLYARYTA